ncbi:MAG: hypothetical protein V4773_12650 [Verrucomicrobiota bacterium]
MSLTLATLIPGLLLLALGVPLLLNHSGFAAVLKAFPRSQAAAYLFFGAGAAWFLWGAIWKLSPADFGEYRLYLFFGFLVVAILSFKCVPDFLAVRGLATLILMGAMPLLDAGFMHYEHWQINFYKVLVYVAISLAIWLGAQPWRFRDFVQWLLAQPERARGVGGAIAGYGLLLAIVAFTY